MTPSDQRNLWGYLYAWRPKLREVDGWYRSHELQCTESGAPGWLHLVWPPAPHSPDGSDLPLRYFLRLSRRRFLLVGPEPTLVTRLLQHVGIEWMVTRPPIDVHRVALDFVARPSEYCLGGVWARVEGYGQSLRTMGVFGNDLADTALFKELLSTLSCYQLRLRDVRRNTEVLTVGSRAEIGLTYTSPKNLVDAEAALGFLSKRGYVVFEDEPDKGES